MKKFIITIDPVIEEIINSIALSCNTNVSYIQSTCRKRYLAAYPRMLCFLFAKAFTDYSLAEIGYMVSNKDHSTVLHGIRTISTLVFIGDMAICEMFDACRINLTAGNLDRILKLEKLLTKLKNKHYVFN